MNAEEHSESILRRLCHWSLSLVVSISVLSLTGWTLGSTILTGLSQSFIPTAPSTALCFFILGIPFLIYTIFAGRILRTVTALFASLTILIVSILLITFLMGIAIEAEHLGFAELYLKLPYRTGYMSPVTAMMFIFVSSGIFLLCLPDQKQMYKNVASFMGLAVGGAGLAMILGYVHGTPLLYGGTIIPVALPTAVSFVFLGLGIILASGYSVPVVRLFVGSSMRSRLTRAFLPVSVVFVVIFDLIDITAEHLAVNTALTISLSAIVTTMILGFIIEKIATSTGAEIDNLHKERDEKMEGLRVSEERLKDIIFSIVDWVWEVDEKGVYTYSSQKGIDLFGESRGDIIGKTPFDFMPPDEAKRVAAIFSEIVANKAPIKDLENWNIGKDGERICLLTSGVPILDKKGNLKGYRGVDRDITDRKRTEEHLQQTLESLRKAVGTTIQVMVSAVESRDPYTSGHQLRSADLARAIATEMGLPPEKIEGIRMAGSIHDIGKISIPAEILSKPTKLSEIEFSLIKEHARKGFEMLKDVESPWPLADIIYQHHERMDGSGYPRNLKGDDILIEARILAVADVVEAMASHRPYRGGFGIDAALNEIEKNKGISYDKAVADACLRLFREKGFKLNGIDYDRQCSL